jgi:trimethyllysine dioxygenase
MAARLEEEDHEAYNILSTTNLFAHASGNEGVNIQPAHAFPVLNHTPGVKIPRLTQVRWNTADRAGVDLTLGPDMERWYDAAA